MDAPAVYDARLAEIRADLGALEARSSRISTLRGVTFLSPSACLGGARTSRRCRPPSGSSRARSRRRSSPWSWRTRCWSPARASSACRVTWSNAATPNRGRSRRLPDKGEDSRRRAPSHAYASDLDVFGTRVALPARVARPRRARARRRLASWLAGARRRRRRSRAPGGRARARRRSPRFREDSHGGRGRVGDEGREGSRSSRGPRRGRARGPEPDAPHDWCAIVPSPRARFRDSSSWRRTRRPPSASVAVSPSLAQLVLLLAMRAGGPWPSSMPRRARRRSAGLLSLFRAIEPSRSAPRLATLREELAPPAPARRRHRGARADQSASPSSATTGSSRPPSTSSSSGTCSAPSPRRWRDARGQLDARSHRGARPSSRRSRASRAFAYEHPDFAFPEVTTARRSFEAEALGHPLIAADRRVANDVALAAAAARALVITGSNMSGKSTLLRAIGRERRPRARRRAGVRARASVSPARVRTSMRIKDSLEEGVSHFYAELARLKRRGRSRDGRSARCSSCSTRCSTARTRASARSAPAVIQAPRRGRHRRRLVARSRPRRPRGRERGQGEQRALRGARRGRER